MSNQSLVEKKEVQKGEKRREHICLCLDRSGSMSSPMGGGQIKSSIQATTEASIAIITISSPDLSDFSIVSFESSPRLEAEKTNDFLSLCSRVYLKTGGGTAMDLGLSMAIQQSPDRIILLSDGQPTCSEESLFSVVDTASSLKIKIDTISIGGADDRIMQEIARRTGGVWKRCDDPTQLVQHFVKLESKARLLLEHRS